MIKEKEQTYKVLPNELKVSRVQELTERLKDAKAIVLVDYKGINIEEVDNLRGRMRESQVDYFVSKNTFIKKALNTLGISLLDESLVGPTAVAISKEDEIRSEEHTSELQSRPHLVCRLLLEKKK